MNGYLIQRLTPTGWRIQSEIHWRVDDVMRASRALISNQEARAVRVVSVQVASTPLFEYTNVEGGQHG